MPNPNIDLPSLAEVLSDSPGWLDEAIDTAEAGRIIGFTPRTLDTWRSRGGGPPFLKLGRRAVRYQRRTLFEWLERQRRDTADKGGSHG